LRTSGLARSPAAQPGRAGAVSVTATEPALAVDDGLAVAVAGGAPLRAAAAV
jgi:hypothetical protein